MVLMALGRQSPALAAMLWGQYAMETTPIEPLDASSADLFCPGCGYNLRGIESDRCPECGKAFQRHQLSASQIPWTHRHHIGRFRAFLQTVSTAAFHPQLLANSIQADLSRRDARWFVALCVLPLAAGLGMLLFWLKLKLNLVISGRGSSLPALVLYPFYLVLSQPVLLVATALLLARSLCLLPAQAARFWPMSFARREQTISAAAYLAGALVCGSLVGLGATFLLWAMFIAAHGKLDEATLQVLRFLVATIIPATALLLWAIACYRFHRRSALLSGGSAPSFWLLYPLLFLLSLTLYGLLLPWLAGLLCLMVTSLSR
jgi:hypothetical protein